MIKVEPLTTAGWMPAIIGMRNPLDSWAKIDSEVSTGVYSYEVGGKVIQVPTESVHLGTRDAGLMVRLLRPGTSDHCKFRRQIAAYISITAPLYWWKEFDTYKVGTVANSTSTMHTIHKSEFTVGDFSHDQLGHSGLMLLEDTIRYLNRARGMYLREEDASTKKQLWYCMIQALPSSYLQTRMVSLNYEVLANMVTARRHHKLNEWRFFVEVVCDRLPYSFIFDSECFERVANMGERAFASYLLDQSLGSVNADA